jgi:hypothetical protein
MLQNMLYIMKKYSFIKKILFEMGTTVPNSKYKQKTTTTTNPGFLLPVEEECLLAKGH